MLLKGPEEGRTELACVYLHRVCNNVLRRLVNKTVLHSINAVLCNGGPGSFYTATLKTHNAMPNVRTWLECKAIAAVKDDKCYILVMD